MDHKEHVVTHQPSEAPGQITVRIPYTDTLNLTKSLTSLLRALKDERRQVNRRLTFETNEELRQASKEPLNSH